MKNKSFFFLGMIGLFILATGIDSLLYGYLPSSPTIHRTNQKNEFYQINLNQVSWMELTAVPGIGSKKARLILSARKKGGAFSSMKDLKKVPYIGWKSLENLQKFSKISNH